MRQFMMTVTALAVLGTMMVTAQAETPSPGQVSRWTPEWKPSSTSSSPSSTLQRDELITLPGGADVPHLTIRDHNPAQSHRLP
jgi:hypothetical protein